MDGNRDASRAGVAQFPREGFVYFRKLLPCRVASYIAFPI